MGKTRTKLWFWAWLKMLGTPVHFHLFQCKIHWLALFDHQIWVYLIFRFDNVNNWDMGIARPSGSNGRLEFGISLPAELQNGTPNIVVPTGRISSFSFCGVPCSLSGIGQGWSWWRCKSCRIIIRSWVSDYLLGIEDREWCGDTGYQWYRQYHRCPFPIDWLINRGVWRTPFNNR